jgi:excisionase family DNA binding protein
LSKEQRRWASVRGAAVYAPCSEKSIRNYIASGELPAYRFGPKNIRIDLDDLDALFTRIPAVEASDLHGAA